MGVLGDAVTVLEDVVGVLEDMERVLGNVGSQDTLERM